MYSDCVSKRRDFFRGRLRKSVLKSAFLATATIGLIGGSAFAADLPTRKGPPIAPVYVPPPFTWTGFYVGVNAGGAWTNGNNNNNNFGFPFVGAVPFGGTSIPFATSGSSNRSGFIGGGQVGYNYQFGIGSGFVLGGEADIDWANINRKNNNLLFGSSANHGVRATGVAIAHFEARRSASPKQKRRARGPPFAFDGGEKLTRTCSSGRPARCSR
jgi:opacity protein-like surface antigen